MHRALRSRYTAVHSTAQHSTHTRSVSGKDTTHRSNSRCTASRYTQPAVTHSRHTRTHTETCTLTCTVGSQRASRLSVSANTTSCSRTWRGGGSGRKRQVREGVGGTQGDRQRDRQKDRQKDRETERKGFSGVLAHQLVQAAGLCPQEGAFLVRGGAMPCTHTQPNRVHA